MIQEIWCNILGEWVLFTTADKIQGQTAYMWLSKNSLYDLKKQFVLVKYQGQEHIIHISQIQLRFVKED